jgi:hypothetical protein
MVPQWRPGSSHPAVGAGAPWGGTPGDAAERGAHQTGGTLVGIVVAGTAVADLRRALSGDAKRCVDGAGPAVAGLRHSTEPFAAHSAAEPMHRHGCPAPPSLWHPGACASSAPSRVAPRTAAKVGIEEVMHLRLSPAPGCFQGGNGPARTRQPPARVGMGVNGGGGRKSRQAVPGVPAEGPGEGSCCLSVREAGASSGKGPQGPEPEPPAPLGQRGSPRGSGPRQGSTSPRADPR